MMSGRGFWSVSLCAALLFMMAGAAFAAPDYPVQMRPGFMAGDGDVGTDVYLDVLVPLAGTERSLFFFNPNLRFDDSDGNEQNVGFGFRTLTSCGHAILGGNAYYDTMRSASGHRYKQWGLGAELLTQWIDLRFNYYDVFGDDAHVLGGTAGGGDYYFSGNSLLAAGGLNIEQALDGYDAEVAVLVPGLSDIMETRLAAAYFAYDASHSDDPDGWRGRLDMRPVRALNLSVEYRDDDLRGSEAFVGGYLELPFSVEKLLAGQNPFAGAGEAWAFGTGARPLETRMTDKVIRDRHIVAVQSGTAGGGGVPVVDDAMIFVNQDKQEFYENNPEVMPDGSYEYPYASLESVPEDARFAPGAWIYIFSLDDVADTYANTHLTLLDDMVLWGQGYAHPEFGLGGGPMPILDGGAPGFIREIVVLADNNEVMGLTLQNGETGIYGRNVRGTYVHDNLVQGNGGFASGIHLYNAWSPTEIGEETLTYRFENNLIRGNVGDGIYLRHSVAGADALDGLSIDNVFVGNRVGDNGNTGISVFVDISTDGTGASISNLSVANTFADNIVGGNALNGDDGILVDSQVSTASNDSPVSNVSVTHSFTDNQVLGNLGAGINDRNLRVDTDGSGSAVSSVTLGSYLDGNTVTDNGEDGYTQNSMEVETRDATSSVSDAVLTVEVTDNVFSHNGEHGFHTEQYAVRGYYAATTTDSGFTATFSGNTAESNGEDGFYFDSDGQGGENTWMAYSFIDNVMRFNGQDEGYHSSGLYLYIDPSNGGLVDKSLFLQGNTITDNFKYGVEVYVNGDDVNDFDGDFGGGPLGSTGGNTFADNGSYDIYHRGEPDMDIWALNNRWTNDADPESTIYDVEDSLSAGDIIPAMQN